MIRFPRLLSASAGALLATTLLAPAPARAHKVSAVSVVASFETKDRSYKVELAMDVDPTGDPAVDDQTPPEEAARAFATQSIEVFFDDLHVLPQPSIRMVTQTDENTPQSLVRKAVIATLAGTYPEKAESFLLRVDENTEASVVMVTSKDGKNARRLQVLYPGEFSNPLSLAPLLEGDPFVSEGRPASALPAVAPVRTPGDGSVSVTGWFVAGFRTVLPHGIDYWAFLLAVFLLNPSLRALGWQWGAHTVAFSLILSLAAFKLLPMPGGLALLALAIAVAAAPLYPAIENVFVSGLKPWRAPLVGLTGALHGLVVAHAFGLQGPDAVTLPVTLSGFALGFVVAAFVILLIAAVPAMAAGSKTWFRGCVRLPLCIAIAGTAIYRAITVLLENGGR